MSSTVERPLSGIRVIDFGQYVAGPAASLMLADFGAEVIRVDPPGGPRWDSPAAAVLNRGKKSIVLNLKCADDWSVARALVQSADVVVENFRPGVMVRLGLGAEVARESNPRLVYLSLPGFSSRDPERGGMPAWEGVVAAACGQFTDMGLNRVLMGIDPSFSPLPLASAYASVLGAAAVLFALYCRESTGQGDAIEVPLASALMEGLAYNSQFVERYPDRYKSLREKEIERRRAAGEPMNVDYAALQELLDPFYRNYVCADGRPFYVVSASHRDHPLRVLEELGLWEEMRTAGVPRFDPYLDAVDWPDGADCTLASYPLSKSWSDRLSARMKEVFRRRTAFEWEQRFGAAGAPGAAQRTTREWLQSEHALSSGLVLDTDDPRYGRFRQAGNVAWLAGDTGVLEKAAAPTADADRTEILGSLASADVGSAPETPDLAAKGGGWLDGIRILDLTNVIAGPTIASTLARFGAEVISIDPVRPTMDPWNAVIFGMQANRGKRSLLLDLRSADGRAALDRLLARVDVVTVNAVDRQLDGLGLAPEHLKSRHPHVILCQLDCYGGPMRGPRSDHPGYDDLAQASTGVMTRFGGSLETPEEHAHFGTIDVLGGFCASLAVGAALVKRARTGSADVARASLCAAGNLIQIPFMFDYAGRSAFDEPSGRGAKGWGPLYRAYRAADGWLFLAARLEQLPDIDRIQGLGGTAGLRGTKLEDLLEERFAVATVAAWAARLSAIDVAAQPLEKMHDVRERSLVHECERGPDLEEGTFAFVRHDPHPSGRFVDLVAPNAIRPVVGKLSVPGPAPKYGAHTREILAELGFDDARVGAMIEQGTAAVSWSRQYLPN